MLERPIDSGFRKRLLTAAKIPNLKSPKPIILPYNFKCEKLAQYLLE